MPYKSLEITNANVVPESSAQTVQFYKGFSTINAANPTSKLFDLDLIKQDLLNIFSTRRGERVMNPTFGSIIWDLLMEPVTPAVRDALNADIKKICTSDPRVIPTQMKLTEYPTGYILEVTLKLKGSNQTTQMRLTFDQKIGLLVQ